MKKGNTNLQLNWTVESIDSALLEVPRSDYQKPLNEKRVAQIVAEFDENIANEPKVSYRNGHYYVFDGQHTVAARIMRNGGRHLRIRCKVFRNLTPADEALLFAAQTGFAAKPTPGNCLRAKKFAKDEETLAFCAATENCGFVLDEDGERSDNHISCINTTLRMFRKLTPDQYAEALTVLREAWDGQADSLLNEVIVAVCEFVRVYDGQYNRYVLADALCQYDPRSISRCVKSDFDHPGYRRYVAPIFEIYNKNCGPRKLVMKF